MNGKYAQIIANIIMNEFLADSLLVEFLQVVSLVTLLQGSHIMG
jgi:hypothetical protein